MIWGDAGRLALLELLCSGRLRRRKAQSLVWDHLVGLPWTRRTGRRDELELVDAAAVEGLLTRVWPSWRSVAEAFAAEGLTPGLVDWPALENRRRQAAAASLDLPDRMNRRTAASLVGAHSKVRVDLEGVEQTADGVVRLRPSPGLMLGSLDCCSVAAVLGEVVVPERSLRDGVRLGGVMPRAVLLVENLGVYIDLPSPPGWLLMHVPGWNTRAVGLLLEGLECAVVHFGDLDPNGVRIVRHLRRLRPDLHWLVPDFWAEQIPLRALSCDWPEGLLEPSDPALLHDLARRGLWLEQEPVALDPRLAAALENLQMSPLRPSS